MRGAFSFPGQHRYHRIHWQINTHVRSKLPVHCPKLPSYCFWSQKRLGAPVLSAEVFRAVHRMCRLLATRPGFKVLQSVWLWTVSAPGPASFIHKHSNRLRRRLDTRHWQSEQAFENVVRLNPEDYQAHGSLGALFLQKGDLGQAESHFRAALRINPQDDISRTNLARLLQFQARSRPGP
jgi:hypothetical protein